MRSSKLTGRRTGLAIAGFALLLVLAALSLGGCPALIVPGLAYQGYKTIHQPTASTTTAAAKSTHQRSTSRAQSSPAVVDRSIE